MSKQEAPVFVHDSDHISYTHSDGLEKAINSLRPAEIQLHYSQLQTMVENVGLTVLSDSYGMAIISPEGIVGLLPYHKDSSKDIETVVYDAVVNYQTGLVKYEPRLSTMFPNRNIPAFALFKEKIDEALLQSGPPKKADNSLPEFRIMPTPPWYQRKLDLEGVIARTTVCLATEYDELVDDYFDQIRQIPWDGHETITPPVPPWLASINDSALPKNAMATTNEVYDFLYALSGK